MGIISAKNIDFGQLEKYPYLSDDMTLPSFIKYGVYTKMKLNDNAGHFRKGVTHLQEGAFGVAGPPTRAQIHKIPGGGVLKNNGATEGLALLTKSQMRNAALQVNNTHMMCHQMQEGSPYFNSASSQAYWLSERIAEIQAEYFPGGDPIYGGNYGDFSMGQVGDIQSTDALALNSKLANATAAKAGLPFFQNTFTAETGGSKSLADVQTAYNCGLYPTTPAGNELWVHRMLFMMRRYVVAGWTKWHMLFIWPAFESAGANIAHSGWPYEFNTTNPAGKLRSYGHIYIDPWQAMAIGFLWAQALEGVTKRCFYVWHNNAGYSSDINRHGAVYPGSKPADQWNPAPGSPGTFPYLGEGQLVYPQEPQMAFDGIDQGIRMWKRSYDELGGQGTRAFCSFSTNNGSSYTDPNPGGVDTILHSMANRYGLAQTETLGSKRKWVWYDPFATPGVRRTIRLKAADGAIHDAITMGNKLYCYVGDV